MWDVDLGFVFRTLVGNFHDMSDCNSLRVESLGNEIGNGVAFRLNEFVRYSCGSWANESFLLKYSSAAPCGFNSYTEIQCALFGREHHTQFLTVEVSKRKLLWSRV